MYRLRWIVLLTQLDAATLTNNHKRNYVKITTRNTWDSLLTDVRNRKSVLMKTSDERLKRRWCTLNWLCYRTIYVISRPTRWNFLLKVCYYGRKLVDKNWMIVTWRSSGYDASNTATGRLRCSTVLLHDTCIACNVTN